MNLIEFSIKLGSITSKSGIKAAICDFITNHSIEYNKEKIKEHISNLSIEAFTSYGNNLGVCRNYCLEEKSKKDNQSDSDYLRELQEVIDFLGVLSEIYQEINTEREKAKKLSDESSAIEQQKDVLREIQENIKVFKSEIEDSKKDIKRANDSFYDKISSLLINTVAILGIFVTIAFAGFGVFSIFSNINFSAALESEEAFVKNVFFLLLVSFLCYNLLLLLVYFIFKLSRPLFNKKSSDASLENITFSQVINLTPFIWIDVVLGLLSLGAFIVSLCVW